MLVEDFEKREGVLLALIQEKRRYEGLVTLVARMLKAGVMEDGGFRKTTKKGA